jgi:hypothetical protein
MTTNLPGPSPTCRTFHEKENVAEEFIQWRDYLRDLSQNLKEINMRLQRFVKGNATLRRKLYGWMEILTRVLTRIRGTSRL